MMTSHFWIGLALLSALFTSIRHLYIKKYCSNIPAEILIFITRGLGAIFYAIIAIEHSIVIYKTVSFFLVVFCTSLLTAMATVIQIRMIQKYPVSLMVPILSFIPVFMMPWTFLFFNEVPVTIAFLGILLVCTGIMFLQLSGKENTQNKIIFDKRIWLMVLVAFILGLTTTLDRMAIQAATPLSYALVWSVVSTVVMGVLVLRNHRSFRNLQRVHNHIIVQGLFWTGAFLCQMIAIGKTLTIPSGVTYVKLITMFHILLSVVIGGVYFKEKNLSKRILATLMMIAGAGLVLMFH